MLLHNYPSIAIVPTQKQASRTSNQVSQANTDDWLAVEGKALIKQKISESHTKSGGFLIPESSYQKMKQRREMLGRGTEKPQNNESDELSRPQIMEIIGINKLSDYTVPFYERVMRSDNLDPALQDFISTRLDDEINYEEEDRSNALNKYSKSKEDLQKEQERAEAQKRLYAPKTKGLNHYQIRKMIESGQIGPLPDPQTQNHQDDSYNVQFPTEPGVVDEFLSKNPNLYVAEEMARQKHKENLDLYKKYLADVAVQELEIENSDARKKQTEKDQERQYTEFEEQFKQYQERKAIERMYITPLTHSHQENQSFAQENKINEEPSYAAPMAYTSGVQQFNGKSGANDLNNSSILTQTANCWPSDEQFKILKDAFNNLDEYSVGRLNKVKLGTYLTENGYWLLDFPLSTENIQVRLRQFETRTKEMMTFLEFMKFLKKEQKTAVRQSGLYQGTNLAHSQYHVAEPSQVGGQCLLTSDDTKILTDLWTLLDPKGENIVCLNDYIHSLRTQQKNSGFLSKPAVTKGQPPITSSLSQVLNQIQDDMNKQNIKYIDWSTFSNYFCGLPSSNKAYQQDNNLSMAPQSILKNSGKYSQTKPSDKKPQSTAYHTQEIKFIDPIKSDLKLPSQLQPSQQSYQHKVPQQIQSYSVSQQPGDKKLENQRLHYSKYYDKFNSQDQDKTLTQPEPFTFANREFTTFHETERRLEEMDRQAQIALKPFKARPVPKSAKTPLYKNNEINEMNRQIQKKKRMDQTYSQAAAPNLGTSKNTHPTEKPYWQIQQEYRFKANPIPANNQVPLMEKMDQENKAKRQKRLAEEKAKLEASSALPPRMQMHQRQQEQEALQKRQTNETKQSNVVEPYRPTTNHKTMSPGPSRAYRFNNRTTTPEAPRFYTSGTNYRSMESLNVKQQDLKKILNDSYSQQTNNDNITQQKGGIYDIIKEGQRVQQPEIDYSKQTTAKRLETVTEEQLDALYASLHGGPRPKNDNVINENV